LPGLPNCTLTNPESGLDSDSLQKRMMEHAL
jgi:hypothetical protein